MPAAVDTIGRRVRTNDFFFPHGPGCRPAPGPFFYSSGDSVKHGYVLSTTTRFYIISVIGIERDESKAPKIRIDSCNATVSPRISARRTSRLLLCIVLHTSCAFAWSDSILTCSTSMRDGRAAKPFIEVEVAFRHILRLAYSERNPAKCATACPQTHRLATVP